MSNSVPRLNIVLSTALLGGTERQMLLYLRYLDRSRVHPRVVITQTHELSHIGHVGSITEELEKADVPYSVTPEPRFYHPRSVAFLARELWRSSDVTMLFGFAIGWAGRLMLWPQRSRVINGIRNHNIHRAPTTMKVERLLSRLVDLYISNSYAARDYYADEASIPREKIVVIPNSVDVLALRKAVPSNARERLRKEFGLPEDALIGINISNIRPRKGHDELVRTVSRLRHRYPKLYFLFVGHDNSDGAVHRRIEEHGVVDRIYMPGFRRDISALIAGADVMVQPSYSEGMSNSIMEGMALGLPIVASDVGDNRLLLEKSGGGVVCAAGDVGELTQALAQVLADENRSTRWGRRGATWAEQEFSVDAYVERTTRVVEVLAAGGSPSACQDLPDIYAE